MPLESLRVWVLRECWPGHRMWKWWLLGTGAAFGFMITRERCRRTLTLLVREVRSVGWYFALSPGFVSSCPAPTGGDGISMFPLAAGFMERLVCELGQPLHSTSLDFLSRLAAAVHRVCSWHDLISPLFITNASIPHVLPRGSFWGQRPTWIFFF